MTNFCKQIRKFQTTHRATPTKSESGSYYSIEYIFLFTFDHWIKYSKLFSCVLWKVLVVIIKFCRMSGMFARKLSSLSLFAWTGLPRDSGCTKDFSPSLGSYDIHFGSFSILLQRCANHGILGSHPQGSVHVRKTKPSGFLVRTVSNSDNVKIVGYD